MERLEVTTLSEIAKRNIVRRSELVQILSMPKEAVDSLIRNLEGRGLVQKVSPMGEASFALTQRGMKTLQEMG